MTIFVKVPKKIEAAFRARYQELTGEGVQANAPENKALTHILFGTSRCMAVAQKKLKAEFPSVVITKSYPKTWKPKPEVV